MTNIQNTKAQSKSLRYELGQAETVWAVTAKGACREHSARDLKTSQNVCLQTADKALFNEDAIFRFTHEIQRLCKSRNEGVLVPEDFGVGKTYIYSATQTSGLSRLGEIDIQLLSIPDRIGLVIDILEGLSFVHELGLVHCNIQPSNVFVQGKRAKLGGWGPSRFLNPCTFTRPLALEFAKSASPELSGSLDHDVGPASDIYSVGVLLFWLLSGKFPFEANSVSGILFQHVTIEPPIDSLPADVPEVLRQVAAAMLRKDPPNRYQTAASVLFDLQAVRQRLADGKQADDFLICRHEIKPAVSDPDFVGRTHELSQLREELELAHSEDLRTVLIGCPSGIGKSRLVMEFIRHATKKNWGVLRGRGSNEASQEPMEPLLEVVQQLGERVLGDTELAQKLRSSLALFETEIACTSPEFARAIGFDTEKRIMGPEEFGQQRIENALATLLATASSADQPLLIWIDDCQWLDEQTLNVLGQLCRSSVEGLLLLFSTRTEIAEKVEDLINRVNPHREIRLGPLSEKEIELLQKSMTGPLPPIALQTVIKHASGSPFMASAIVRGMFEAKAIQLSHANWDVDVEKLAKFQAANDAAHVLLQRIQNLEESTLGLLSVAAIIGKEFDIQSVSEIAQVQDYESEMELAREMRLIWAKPNGEYCFVHDKIRESLIGCLSESEKKRIHFEAAEYLDENRPHLVFDLAFHFFRSGNADRARGYAIKAAQSALDRFSLGVAEDQLKIAMASIENCSRELQYTILSAYADVTILDGRYEEAESWLKKAKETTETPLEKAHVVLKWGELEFKKGNKETAVAHFESALADLGTNTPRVLFASLFKEIIVQGFHTVLPKFFVASAPKDPTEKDRLTWRLLSRLGEGYWFTRDKYQTLWSHLLGMNRAEKYKPSPELAQFYSDHAPALSLLPWHSRGLEYADKSLQLRKQFGDIWGQGQSRNFKSILLYSSSEFEKCVEQAGRAVTVLDRTGDFWEMHIARYQRAASLYRMGDLKGAAREARETYQSAIDLGDYQSSGNIIDVWVRSNLNKLPQDVIDLETSRTLRDTQGQCQVLLAEGIRWIGEENYTEAIERFRDAIKRSTKAGICNTYITPNYPWLATALRLNFGQRKFHSARSDKQPLKELLRAAKKAVKVGGKFQNELPHALRELGAAYALLGKLEKSKSAMFKSIEVAKNQGAIYEQAKSEQLLGQLSRQFGWKEFSDLAEMAEHRIHEIEQHVQEGTQATALSISDRFENLLDAGRQISIAGSHEEIKQTCCDAANRLLRAQRTIWLDVENSVAQIDEHEVDPDRIAQAVKSRSTLISSKESRTHRSDRCSRGSYLIHPVLVKDKVAGVLYVANDAVYGLFGGDEKRIAEFLGSATATALEKSTSFAELEKLNEGLEKRVEQRTRVLKTRSEELESTAAALRSAQASLEHARDKAESANSAKSQFLAHMSHEIRTPIGAILGFAELIMRGVVHEPEHQKEKVETIYQTGKHLLRLVNNILDLSKVEADELDPEVLEFEPVKIASEVVATLKDRAAEKSIDLKMELVGEVPRKVASDPTFFRQIVTNLVGNAVKFTTEGSVVVRIASNVYDLNQVIQDPRLFVDVEDTGIGMNSEQVARVFDPFSQADSSITRKFGGTGLGLAISKRIASALGGDIEVSSVPNKGSCFKLSMSIGLPEQVAFVNQSTFDSVFEKPELKSWNTSFLKGTRVLVVDDAETNRELLGLILESAGVEVAQAENGQDAIETIELAHEDFDLIIMDMQMPVMDGYSATRELRRLGFEFPIVALTANSMKDDDQKCLKAGCSDYMSKPIDTAALLEKIASHLELSVQEQTVPNKNRSSVIDDKPPIHPEIAQLADKLIIKMQSKKSELVEAFQSKNCSKIADFGHWLKGTAAMVGLEELASVGATLDVAGKNGEFDRVKTAIADIEYELVNYKCSSPCTVTTNVP